MIPVLFPTNATSWTTNGLGGLADAVSCSVQEERNGAYKMTMVYPVDGLHYSEIVPGSPILCDCGAQRGKQVFRVSKITRPINGQVKIEAEHLSYQLSLIPCSPFTAGSVTAALSGLASHAAVTCPFTFWTNKSTSATYNQTVPASIRSRLGGVQGSILDVYGGEWEFDGYTCRLWSARGSNKGVTIRYGKNLTDLTQEQNIANTITGIYPFYTGDHAYVELPEKVLSSSNAGNFPFPRTVPLDLSQEFDSTPTVAQLRAKGQAYLNGSGIGVPAVSLKVKFVNLADTEEYENVAALETVELCDTVTVIYEKLGVQATAKVIKTDWDVLAERYNSVEIGDAKTSLADTIAQTKEEVATAVTASALERAVDQATALITGATGGYVKFNYNGDGQPYEMLIMDAEQEEDATNIWRFNANGWGFSRNGGVSYTTAATIDGGIIADFITAGTLTGLNINNGNGTFLVDETGAVTASDMTITGGSMSIEADTDVITPLIISGSYSTQTPTRTTDHEYTVELSRQGVTVTDTAWSYVTADGRPTYPTSKSVSEYKNGGATYRYYVGNGAAEPTAQEQFAQSKYNGHTATVSGGDVATIGAVPIDGSAGFFVRRSSMTRPVVAVDETSLRWYNSSNALVGEVTPSDAEKLTALGTLTTASASSVSMATGTWTNLGSIAHVAGTYLVTAYYAASTNANGYRTLMLTSSATGSSPITPQARSRVAAASGAETTVLVSTIVEATAAGAWYMRAIQNSGAALTVSTAEIRILRII